LKLEELIRIADSCSIAVDQSDGPTCSGCGDTVDVQGNEWEAGDVCFLCATEWFSKFNPTLIKAMLREIEAARNFRDAHALSYGDSFLYEDELEDFDKAREESGVL
jgi:hypothetical protein